MATEATCNAPSSNEQFMRWSWGAVPCRLALLVASWQSGTRRGCTLPWPETRAKLEGSANPSEYAPERSAGEIRLFSVQDTTRRNTRDFVIDRDALT